MKILSAEQLHKADEATLASEKITPLDLMERAAYEFCKWFAGKFDKSQPVKLICGLGNNGGDGLAIARILRLRGFSPQVFIVRYSEKSSADFQANEVKLEAYPNIPVVDLTEKTPLPELQQQDIIIDALFGTGINKPVKGLPLKIIQHVNKSEATVVAVDVPSGLYIDSHTSGDTIQADITATYEAPKLAFFFAENYRAVGEWVVIPLGLDPEFIAATQTTRFYMTEAIVRSIIAKHPRKKFDHKGSFGHALLVCGSQGKMGAAVMATQACLRSGVGLVTAHIPGCGYDILQTLACEAMVEVDSNDKSVSEVGPITPYQAIGIGPGLGTGKLTQEALYNLFDQSELDTSVIIDADALNILALKPELIEMIPPQTILTPHPGELERLAGKSADDFEQHSRALHYARDNNVYIVLKGAHSQILTPQGNSYFNSTGNPALAKGGSGDMLTGLLTGLRAQGYNAEEACIVGVYLHGLIADIAVEKHSPYALTVEDFIATIDAGFQRLFQTSES